MTNLYFLFIIHVVTVIIKVRLNDDHYNKKYFGKADKAFLLFNT